jgi:hypothetical protein
LERLYSLPRNRPVAWFPASARWHVFRFPVSAFSSPPENSSGSLSARLKTGKIPNGQKNLSNHEIECIISRWILNTIP